MDKRIQELKDSPLIEKLKNKKIGLVLGGGGAKGAYQIGAIRLLQKLGITRFDIISGASVGALNAVAISQNKVDEAEKLWRRIGFHKILTPSIRILIFLPLYIIGGYLIAQSKKIGFYLSLLLTVILVTIIQSVFQLSLFNLILILLTSLTITITISQYSQMFYYKQGLSLIRFAVSRSSISSQKQIKAIAKEFLSEIEKRVHYSKTFITIARDGYLFDPDYPSFNIVKTEPRNIDIHFDIEAPRLKHTWIPQYREISNEAQPAAIELVSMSAALPGVFRFRRNEYGLNTDGGLVDNVPLLPVIESNCDVIFVIQLSSEFNTKYDLINHSNLMKRLLELEREANGKRNIRENIHYKAYKKWLKNKLSAFEKSPGSDTKNYRNKNYPLDGGLIDNFDVQDLFINLIGKHKDINYEYYNINEAKDWRLFHTWDLLQTSTPMLFRIKNEYKNVDLINLVPSNNLGGWTKGTLNFRKKYTNKLISLGYSEMLNKMEDYIQAKEKYYH